MKSNAVATFSKHKKMLGMALQVLHSSFGALRSGTTFSNLISQTVSQTIQSGVPDARWCKAVRQSGRIMGESQATQMFGRVDVTYTIY